jgi:hypothetical protein
VWKSRNDKNALADVWALSPLALAMVVFLTPYIYKFLFGLRRFRCLVTGHEFVDMGEPLFRQGYTNAPYPAVDELVRTEVCSRGCGTTRNMFVGFLTDKDVKL